MKDENMLTAQALREIEERVIRWRAAITDGDDTNLVFAPWNFKALQDLLADRKALVEVLREIIDQTDCPDGRPAIDIVKERARRALQEDR